MFLLLHSDLNTINIAIQFLPSHHHPFISHKLKSNIISPTMPLSKTTCALFILLFLFLVAPCFSDGEPDGSGSSPVVYDIDYRGPETHTTVPPPKRGRRRRRNIIHHQQTMVARHKRFKSSHGHNEKKYGN
nr:Topoisomerase 1-associated factor like [Ipomoea batatas]